MELNIAGQGLKVYSQQYYCKRTKEELQEIIFEPQNEQGQSVIDALFPLDRKHPSGVTRKEFTDRWGRPNPELGSYVRVKPYGIADLRGTNGSVQEETTED